MGQKRSTTSAETCEVQSSVAQHLLYKLECHQIQAGNHLKLHRFVKATNQRNLQARNRHFASLQTSIHLLQNVHDGCVRGAILWELEVTAVLGNQCISKGKHPYNPVTAGSLQQMQLTMYMTITNRVSSVQFEANFILELIFIFISFVHISSHFISCRVIFISSGWHLFMYGTTS